MNALLIYPEVPETFWSFRHALKFIRKRAAHPPLGLLTVATLLPDDWNVRLIDANVTPLARADLAWADVALVGGMTLQRDSARAVLARCADAGVRTVAGGPLFSSEPESFPEVDHLVLNEAEITLPRFLHDFLSRGRARRVYRSDDLADMSASPIPRWDLADLSAYASTSVQYSRGCPYDCDFCSVTALFGRAPRTKDAAQIVAELDALWAAGWRERVFFVDDNLIGHRKRLRHELLPALIGWRRRHRGTGFFTQASINLADDPALMRDMVAAGFDTVFIGIETPDDDSLAECGKHHNLSRDLVADVRRIQRAGMQVQGGFIVGFDHDTPSVFQRQIDFIQSSGIVTAMVGMLQAPVGTRLYQRLKGEGRLLGEPSGDNVAGWTNVVPSMGLETLRSGYRDLMRSIYMPENYYRRIRTFLREYRPPRFGGYRLPRLRALPAHRAELAAFVRSLWQLGVRRGERAQYWKLLGWTMLRRPHRLNLAITLAIYGHHFRKVCELRVG
ncbi:MAG: DUF4070 domain-containing protein [Acidobacteriota bacterium]